MLNNACIGIYDSGIGGLTVLKEVKKQLPNEAIIYYGDTLHLPYGDKSKQDIINYNVNILNIFQNFACKMVISACNTSSAIALPILKERYQFPIISIIEPGVKEAINISLTKKIGVIATVATVNSLAYAKAFKRIDHSIDIQQVACPEFVPLIEALDIMTEETFLIAKNHLDKFKDVDTLVYGCTHYPLLEPVFKKIYAKKDINLVNPAIAVVKKAKEKLASLSLFNDQKIPSKDKFIWSGEIPKNIKYLSF